MEVPDDRPRILLLCGGEVIERETLFGINTPPLTETWFPLPHRHLIVEVENQLTAAGFQLLGQTQAISHDGYRHFGTLEVSQFGNMPKNGHGWVVGLRNSHDKTFPAGLAAGTRVLVCDNLAAFSGLIQIRRKHRGFAVRDLRQLTAGAVGLLGTQLVQLDRRIEAYRDLRLSCDSLQGYSLVSSCHAGNFGCPCGMFRHHDLLPPLQSPAGLD